MLAAMSQLGYVLKVENDLKACQKKKQTLTMMKMKYCKYTIILATAVNQSCECFYLISTLTIIAKLLMDWPENQNHHTYVFGLKMRLFGF